MDIDTFAKEATDLFLTQKIPLTQTIIKQAEQHGFNREQINRVVETTNASTYTSLFNQSDDRYINFDHADSEDILAAVKVEKKASIPIRDYDDPVFEEIFIEPTSEIFEKTAEPTTQSLPTNLYNEYVKIASASSKCMEELYLLDQKFQTESETLKQQIKTAVIQGSHFGDLYKAASVTVPCPLLSTVLDTIHSELKQELPLSFHNNLTKESSERRRINTDHPFIKQSESVCQCVSELQKLLRKQEELATQWDDFEKSAKFSETLQKIIKNLKKPIEHPGLSLSMLGIGAAGGAATVATIDHNKQMVENSPLNSIPQHYQR
jgi:hypothetical protein